MGQVEAEKQKIIAAKTQQYLKLSNSAVEDNAKIIDKAVRESSVKERTDEEEALDLDQIKNYKFLKQLKEEIILRKERKLFNDLRKMKDIPLEYDVQYEIMQDNVSIVPPKVVALKQVENSINQANIIQDFIDEKVLKLANQPNQGTVDLSPEMKQIIEAQEKQAQALASISAVVVPVKPLDRIVNTENLDQNSSAVNDIKNKNKSDLDKQIQQEKDYALAKKLQQQEKDYAMAQKLQQEEIDSYIKGLHNNSSNNKNQQQSQDALMIKDLKLNAIHKDIEKTFTDIKDAKLFTPDQIAELKGIINKDFNKQQNDISKKEVQLLVKLDSLEKWADQEIEKLKNPKKEELKKAPEEKNSILKNIKKMCKYKKRATLSQNKTASDAYQQIGDKAIDEIKQEPNAEMIKELEKIKKTVASYRQQSSRLSNKPIARSRSDAIDKGKGR